MYNTPQKPQSTPIGNIEVQGRRKTQPSIGVCDQIDGISDHPPRFATSRLRGLQCQNPQIPDVFPVDSPVQPNSNPPKIPSCRPKHVYFMAHPPHRDAAAGCRQPRRRRCPNFLCSRPAHIRCLCPGLVQGGFFRQAVSIRTLEFFRQDVKLNSHSDLERFLENVPRAYCRHIEMLDVGTEGEARVHADALISLLLASPRLAQLVLRLNGSLDSSVISSFGFLANLRHLTIRNCAEEVILPL